MSSAELTEQFLTYVITIGSPALALALLLGALGIPLPGTFFVLAGGAFVRQGVLDLPTTLGLSFVAVVMGDCISYGMGRFANVWVAKHFGHSSAWQSAQKTFNQRGGVAIYLTRFLLTPLALPTNLVAGTSAYPFWRFFLYDSAGEVTWFLVYGGLGYMFGSQWELISEFISDFSGLLVGLVALGGGIYMIMGRRNKEQAIGVMREA